MKVVDQRKHSRVLEVQDDEEMLCDVEVQNRCNKHRQQNDRVDHGLLERHVEVPKVNRDELVEMKWRECSSIARKASKPRRAFSNEE